jgi:hypothetical protein
MVLSRYLNLTMNSIGITDPKTQLQLNGCLTTFGLVTNTFFSFFVDRFRRRPIYLTSTIGTLVAFTIWTIISARYAISPAAGLGRGVVVMIFVYYFFYNIKLGSIPVSPRKRPCLTPTLPDPVFSQATQPRSSHIASAPRATRC